MSNKKVPSPINLSDGLPMHTTIEQLKAILSQPATNIGDKAVLLDARDRLIRLRKDGKDKIVTIGKVSTLKGTCLDMCPEKERYSRAEKRRLALYEMLDKDEKEYEVDHRLAVKEYSRSSADQAEPLAHELRPLPVLQMTMDYLIARIVDRCDKLGENLAEWFNFLWDRMRGIRKDITQQSLCEEGSVDLVEKCARFHIHCTARLCELDMQDFDQKINDENLTKCLQTLKHMYYDLSVKNIFCPNEAEFRGYDVLLHLNDGDILREVLQLRAEVRDSREVRTALQFVNTLNSRNYVRFFKLARSNKSYLQSCLLQRYFNQMRNQALQIMVQAYGPPKKGQVHLTSLVNLLGFEDEEEAAVWCECHGLPIDLTKRTVKFDRTTFVELPEKFPQMRRSSLIESKRLVTVSECLANGPIHEDPTLHHVPQNSFDNKGFLLREALLIEEHVDSKEMQVEAICNPSAQIAISASSPFNLTEPISSRICNELLRMIVDEFVDEIARQTVMQKALHRISVLIAGNFLLQFTNDFCLEVAKETLHELRAAKRKQEQHKLNTERKVLIISEQIGCDLMDSVVCELVHEVAQKEVLLAVQLRMKLLKDEVANQLLNLLINETIVTECEAIAAAVAYEAIKERESLVVIGLQRIKVRRIRLSIDRWRRFTAMQIRRRKEKETFPACPSRRTFQQQVSSLKSKGEPLNVSLKRKSLVEQSAAAKRFNSLSDLHYNVKKTLYSLDELSFDLFTFVEQALQENVNSERNCYWKLVILAITNENVGETFQKWLGLISAKKSINGWFYIETRTTVYNHPFTLCVRFVNDCENIKEALKGASALVIVYDTPLEMEKTLQILIPLIHIQSNYFPLPVALIKAKALSQKLKYNEEALQPCFHATINFNVPHINRHESLFHLFSSLTQAYRTDYILPLNRVRSAVLWDLTNDFVCRKILSTIYRDMQQRLEHNLPRQSFSQLLEFNNSAIRYFVENVVMDPDLCHVRWPPPELVENLNRDFPPNDWNSNEHLIKLKNTLERYLIFPIWQPNEHSGSSIRGSLLNYCTNLSTAELNATAFLARIDSILTKTQLCSEKHRAHHVPSESALLWADIFQACIDYRLQAFHYEGSSLIVGYFTHALDNMRNKEYWIKVKGLLESVDSSNTDNDHQPNEAKNSILDPYISGKRTLELPCGITALCNAISDASRQCQQENEHFEKTLLQVNSPKKMKHKSTPVTPFMAQPASIDDHLELLERSLQQSIYENDKFESFLRRALED